MSSTKKRPHLNLLGQRNDVTLVEVDDSIHIDFTLAVQDFTIAFNDVLCIGGSFFLQSQEEFLFHFGFGDQGLEGRTVRL